MLPITIVESLRSNWLSRGIKINPGVSKATLQLFESKYKVMLPDDLREYFLLVNGMDANSTDEDLIRFWPLEEVKSISEGASAYSDQSYLPDPGSIFLFADYCIWTHLYAIRLSSCEGRNEVYVIGGKSPIFLAGSFTEFATLYLANRSLDILKST